MKAKRKKNNYEIKATHRDMFIIRKALEHFLENEKERIKSIDIDSINNYLYDRDELKDEYEYLSIINKIFKEIEISMLGDDPY